MDLDAGEAAIRLATPEDYAAFARLFPELGVDDPLPGPAVWASAFVPHTFVATDGRGEVVGYCYTQEYDDTGYVRHLVVSPEARRRGVGRTLMSAVAQRLRAGGKTGWRLNVGSRNPAALALYEGLGLRTLYRSHAVRVPWTTANALEPSASVGVREMTAARDAELERLFALPRGQLAAARATKRLVLGATARDGACVGLAVFAPSFPGAFPFRALEQSAVRPLLEAMRPHVTGPHVNLVIDDDDGLVSLLVAAGAEVRGDFLHLGGAL